MTRNGIALLIVGLVLIVGQARAEDKGDKEKLQTQVSGHPAIQVFVRSLLLRTGLTEMQTLSLLGLHNTRLLYKSWTVSGSTCVYPVRPNYQILLRYHLDESSRSIQHILSTVSIEKVRDGG